MMPRISIEKLKAIRVLSLVLAIGGLTSFAATGVVRGWDGPFSGLQVTELLVGMLGFTLFCFAMAALQKKAISSVNPSTKCSDIGVNFRQHVGDSTYNSFIQALSGPCKEKGRLMYWQEEIWRDFCASHGITFTSRISRIARLLGLTEKAKELRKREMEGPAFFGILIGCTVVALFILYVLFGPEIIVRFAGIIGGGFMLILILGAIFGLGDTKK